MRTLPARSAEHTFIKMLSNCKPFAAHHSSHYHLIQGEGRFSVLNRRRPQRQLRVSKYVLLFMRRTDKHRCDTQIDDKTW